MSVTPLIVIGAIGIVIAAGFVMRWRAKARTKVSWDQGASTHWSDAIYGIDVDGRLTFVNEAAEALTGARASNLIGKYAREHVPLPDHLPLSGLPPDFAIRDRLQWNRTRDASAAHETVVVPLEVTVRATKPREAKGTAVLVIARDLSSGESPGQLKDEFISAISQEVRSPMTLIRGYLELMVVGELGSVTEAQRQSLNTVLAAAAQLQGFIEDMLTVAESRSGGLELGLADLDLADLVREGCSAMSDSFANRQLEVVQEIDDTCPFVGDPARLRRMIEHLLSNAERFTPPHGEITIRLFSTGSEIVFEVADNGIGIAPEYRTAILDRFARAPVPAEQMNDNVGLGLSVVDAVVKAHGGAMDIVSEEGSGTTVHVAFPAPAARLDITNYHEGTASWIPSTNHR